MLFDSTVRKDLARSFAATLVVILTIVITMMLIRRLTGARGSFSSCGTPRRARCARALLQVVGAESQVVGARGTQVAGDAFSRPLRGTGEQQHPGHHGQRGGGEGGAQQQAHEQQAAGAARQTQGHAQGQWPGRMATAEPGEGAQVCTAALWRVRLAVGSTGHQASAGRCLGRGLHRASVRSVVHPPAIVRRHEDILVTTSRQNEDTSPSACQAVRSPTTMLQTQTFEFHVHQNRMSMMSARPLLPNEPRVIDTPRQQALTEQHLLDIATAALDMPRARQHWAFQPLPPAPALISPSPDRLDALVRAKLTAAHLTPAPAT